MSQLTALLLHLAIHNMSWRPPMGVTTPQHHLRNPLRNVWLRNSAPLLSSRRFSMSWINIPLSHLTIHDTSWRLLMGVMTTRKILYLIQTRSMRQLKKVTRPNWVRSLNIASYAELTISMIERLSKEWTSPIYVFFRMSPRIDYVDGRRTHIFECAAGRC